MDPMRWEPQTLLRLQSLCLELAQAVAAERRRLRRLDEVVRDGRDPARHLARLDKTSSQISELAAALKPLLLAIENRPAGRSNAGGPPQTRSGRNARDARSRPAGAVVASAVDIGSNSVHLLVAVVAGHRLEPVLDQSEFLDLGNVADEHGELGPALRERLTRTLHGYVARARTLGAERTVLVGTEPLRQASDSSLATSEIEAATGEQVIVLSHDEEAYLTLLGVTAGRPVRRNLVLVDVGGGSSEVLWVPLIGDPIAAGFRLGSARLTRRFVAHDPPTANEIDDMRREARQVLETTPPGHPDEVVIVGGSATNLLRVVPAAAIDRRITRARVAEALDVLAGETASEAAARHGMREPRARTMAAGAAIVEAVLERYGVDRARVDEAGIREGLLLATTHAGAAWRENLAWLAHGWSR
jgi:exopolyphosphatase/guanosine-5'-triphosphate,3'-diphosphate pyrophosphatase